MNDYEIKKLIWLATVIPSLLLVAFNMNSAITYLTVMALIMYQWYLTFIKKYDSVDRYGTQLVSGIHALGKSGRNTSHNIQRSRPRNRDVEDLFE